MGQKLSELRSSTKNNMEDKQDNEIRISLERIHFGIGLPGVAEDDDDDSPRLDEHFEHLYSSEGKDKEKDEDNSNRVVVKPSTSAQLDEAHCSNYCPNTAQRHENLKLFGTPDTRKSKSRRKKNQKKEAAGREKKKRAHWVLRFNCARLKSGSGSSGGSSEPELSEPIASCICTGCKRSTDDHLGAGMVLEARQRRDSTASSDSEPAHHLIDFAENPPRNFIDFTNLTNRCLKYREEMAVEDCDERARLERAREIAEGMEPPPGYRPRQHIQLVYAPDMFCLDSLTVLLRSAALSALSQLDTPNVVHTQVDYIHCLVPDLLQITSCSFYWGKMDRYEAERLLEGKPEGTFLLRDSAQEEYLFSVSFRKYGRSLHARIEQWKHMFSFDSHDPGVYSSPTVCGLIEHYKDPSCCMFFEPTLTYPLHRNFSFPLQHLCRAVICSKISYDGIAQLRLPKSLKSYLKEYHYKQRVKVRVFESE